MVQGAVKKSSKPTTKKPINLPKRGSRVIKPKKATLISQSKIKKKHTAGLIGKTEKLLASKAGHLEMLRGGKKDK
ncbi:hypothetical protein K458DRAFT_247622, partial [Lentithecium fluviatile CBS 122367]